MKTRVVMADDIDDLRWILRHQLEVAGGYEVVAEAANGRDAVDAVVATHPDVAVLDLMMPQMDGMHAAAEIAKRCPDVRVVLYSAVSEAAVAAAGVLTGAVEYARKGSGAKGIIEAVQRATAAA